jgi:rhamnosyltransferase
MKPKIAILLAVYNGVEWLETQLQSILQQEAVAVTVFISVDKSHDGSEVFCQQFAEQYSNIALLPQSEHLGGAAQNFFRLIRDVDFAEFDYVSLSDQDDIWFSTKLCKAVAMIQKNHVEAYSGNVMAFWSDEKQKLIHKAQPQQAWDYMFESAGPGCTFVLKKKLALQLQQFLRENQVYCAKVALHDWFIYAFARSHGFQWWIDENYYLLYRQHTGNVVGANIGMKAKIARLKMLRENWLFTQASLIAQILGYSDAWAIQKISRFQSTDRLALIFNAHKLRRRLRDKIALMLFFLITPK